MLSLLTWLESVDVLTNEFADGMGWLHLGSCDCIVFKKRWRAVLVVSATKRCLVDWSVRGVLVLVWRWCLEEDVVWRGWWYAAGLLLSLLLRVVREVRDGTISIDVNHIEMVPSPDASEQKGANVVEEGERKGSRECPLFWTLLRPPILRLTERCFRSFFSSCDCCCRELKNQSPYVQLF